MSESIYEVWPRETGITDLPADWQTFASTELSFSGVMWLHEREAMAGTEQLALFSERLAREWAIETGLIENLYELDRGVTQTLINQGFQSALIEHGSTNKPREYVIHLLEDQKDALEGLFAFVNQGRQLSTSYIKELHAAITKSQGSADSVDPQGNRVQVDLIRGEWKRWENFPMKEGVELRYCPPEQTASEMDRLLAMHADHKNRNVPPEVEAAWLHHRFTQIHPFQDGNGRVARALASLVFIQSGLFPLVVSRDDKTAYLDALETADSGDLGPLVALFSRLQLNRIRGAWNLADKIQRPATSVEEALMGLTRSANARREPNGATATRVGDLRDLIYRQLEALGAKAQPAIQALGSGFGVRVISSIPENADRFLLGSRIVGAAAYAVMPMRPVAWALVEYSIPLERLAVFQISGVTPNLDGFVQVVAFVDDPWPTVALSDEPLEWYPEESEASLLVRLDDWVERAFIRSLEIVRDSL